jgi:hypothetical protein
MKRPRKDFFWEMQQFDGSYHHRFENRGGEDCLLLAIDDATWRITHAKFCDNEGYECVVDFWEEYFEIHGVPRSIYLDKFSTYKVNHAKAVNTKELRTHFDRSMRKLWSNLISAHSPEAKWRVEKCNGTLQDRLVRELRLAKISTVPEANIFIRDIFIQKYNKQFEVDPPKSWDLHIQLTQEQELDLDRIFAREQLRSLGNDYIIQYKNRFYQVEQSKEYTVYPRKQLLVAETKDGRLHIHAWKTAEEKLVICEEIDHISVKRNRAMYRNQRQKIERERLRQARLRRKEEKHKISKEKQQHRKSQSIMVPSTGPLYKNDYSDQKVLSG